SIRSSGVNSRLLLTLVPTATTTSSNSVAARRTMSRCPNVAGSNDPGQAARRTGPPGLLEVRYGWLLVGGVNVPEHGLAVLLLPPPGEPGGPGRLGAARPALDDDHRAGDQPLLVAQGGQVADDVAVVLGVRRVEEGHVVRRGRGACERPGDGPGDHV